ncbi:P-loop containing nucleoside triphosphate hydrolase protein [Scleroderma yunnanense]
MAPPPVGKRKRRSTSSANPAVARKHFDRIGRFRILIIGRSNAGKTTLLQRICNTTELPEVFNSEGKQRGEHNIEDELVFRSNTGFIFHDSRGFEAGSEKEVELMRKFLTDRSATMKLERRIHAIWYCIPLTDSERPVVAAEELFFNECNTGNVPVIVVLTKADVMELEAIGQLRDMGMMMKEARSQAQELAQHLHQLAGCKHNPNDYVALSGGLLLTSPIHEGMNKVNADCDSLLRCTTNALNDMELQQLVISTQQVNFNLNIEYAIK